MRMETGIPENEYQNFFIKNHCAPKNVSRSQSRFVRERMCVATFFPSNETAGADVRSGVVITKYLSG